ncbi:MAG: isoamylase early set domain-containing protein [Gemmatimonadota bacterium]
MSDEPRVLPFPSEEDDDAVLGAHIAAMYRGYPARSQADADRCAREVIARAKAQPAWRALVPRQRWWWGAAAAAVLVVVTMRPWRPDASDEAGRVFTSAAREATTPPGAAAGSPGGAMARSPQGTITSLDGGDTVRFDLRLATEPKDVSLVGDFNGWDESATPMLRRNGDETWSAQISLSPGRHVYAFVVDGQQWLVDPLAPQVPDAGFGPANAVVIEGQR